MFFRFSFSFSKKKLAVAKKRDVNPKKLKRDIKALVFGKCYGCNLLEQKKASGSATRTEKRSLF